MALKSVISWGERQEWYTKLVRDDALSSDALPGDMTGENASKLLPRELPS